MVKLYRGLVAVAFVPLAFATAQNRPAVSNAVEKRQRAEIDSLRRLIDSLRAQLGPQLTDTDTAGQVVSSAALLAEPFGLKMGMSEKALRAALGIDSVKGQRGVFTTTRVPKPHHSFESYNLVVSPKQGLCKVNAVGRDIRTSVYGSELQSAFNDIEEMVTEKYGKSKRADILRSGSIWDEPRDWMMGLLKQERILHSFWGVDGSPAPAPNIATIGLEASALTTEKGYVRLSFEFANFAACLAELKTNPF